MKEGKILYRIKGLEKLIIRNLSRDIEGSFGINDIFPLTPTQIQIIEYILKNDDKDIYQRDLEAVLNLRRATVSGVLQTMEKNGLVKRVINTNDARIKKIILNDVARELFVRGNNKLVEIEKIITNNIAGEDLVVFSKVLDKMINNLKMINDGKER